MSDTSTPPVEAPTPNPVDDGTEPKNSVSYESHRKLLDEKKQLADRLKKIEDDARAAHEAELIEQGNLKEALELREKELAEERSLRLGYEEKHLNAKKMNAIIKGLGTSVDDKWLPVIGGRIDSVVIDADGNIDMKTVNAVTDSLKKQWPEMIKKEMPNMPNGTPQGGTTTITRSEWLKLSSMDMKKWKPDQII